MAEHARLPSKGHVDRDKKTEGLAGTVFTERSWLFGSWLGHTQPRGWEVQYALGVNRSTNDLQHLGWTVMPTANTCGWELGKSMGTLVWVRESSAHCS
jgi:hypothetical protein